MAKRRKSTRRKTTWEGVTVVLPKGTTKLTPQLKARIDADVSQPQWNSAKGDKCRYVFFTATRGALRCDRNRGTATKQGGMSRAAKKRFNRAGGKRACMKKIGRGKKTRFLFKSC